MSQNEYRPTTKQQALIDASKGVLLGGKPLPEFLRSSVDILQTVYRVAEHAEVVDDVKQTMEIFDTAIVRVMALVALFDGQDPEWVTDIPIRDNASSSDKTAA